MDNIEHLTDSEGQCPYCGSYDIEYGRFEFDGSGGFYPVICKGCNNMYHECYSLTLDGSYGDPDLVQPEREEQ